MNDNAPKITLYSSEAHVVENTGKSEGNGELPAVPFTALLTLLTSLGNT